MFKIGNIEVANRVVLAPLAGISDLAFRLIVRSYGCGLVYTEMISEMGLIYGQKKTLQLADTTEESSPVSVQLFGFEAENVARAASIVENMGADIIDINMGCPTPKIVKNGEGAALMLDIPRAKRIIKEVVNTVKIPVTIKMRKGWDEDLSCFNLAIAAQEAGVQAIAIHPRSRMQFYSGKADWDLIKALKKQVQVPLIGNGDIWTADDAVRMIDYTDCDAVMIARGALGNPFIIREAVALVEENRKIEAAGIEERLETAIKHMDLAVKYKGEKTAIREMRKHVSWYIKGMRGAAKLRLEINKANTREEMLQAISKIKAANE